MFHVLGTEIKQADAILLGYPLLVNMSKTVRQNDLNIYEKVSAKTVCSFYTDYLLSNTVADRTLEASVLKKIKTHYQQNVFTMIIKVMMRR